MRIEQRPSSLRRGQVPMSCELRPIRIPRCVLPFVLIFAAAPSAAFSQSTVCHPIRGGETALQVARRITGDSRNTYRPSFQIMDRSSRFVPKSQYDRIRRGWRACIVKEAVVESRIHVAPARQADALPVEIVAAVRPPSVAADTGRTIATMDLALQRITEGVRPLGLDLTAVWFAGAVIVPLFAWRMLDGYATRRNAKVIVMKHFAHRFVSEFERPLIQQPAEQPVRTLLRLSPVRARMEILLAPGEGRRYPNLSDHKKNMEYDVVRILRVLADDSFVRDPLYMQADWVVVPFRLKARRQHTGAL